MQQRRIDFDIDLLISSLIALQLEAAEKNVLQFVAELQLQMRLQNKLINASG